MRRHAPTVLAVFLVASAVSVLSAQNFPSPPADNAAPAVQYRVLADADLEALTPEPGGTPKSLAPGESSYTPARRMAWALNRLAAEGWELDAIRPFQEAETRLGSGSARVTSPTLYVFRRSR